MNGKINAFLIAAHDDLKSELKKGDKRRPKKTEKETKKETEKETKVFWGEPKELVI